MGFVVHNICFLCFFISQLSLVSLLLCYPVISIPGNYAVMLLLFPFLCRQCRLPSASEGTTEINELLIKLEISRPLWLYFVQ